MRPLPWVRLREFAGVLRVRQIDDRANDAEEDDRADVRPGTRRELSAPKVLTAARRAKWSLWSFCHGDLEAHL
jgi:hypothetical protein